MIIILVIFFVHSTFGQFTSQTYPDPRLDPLSCRLALPSPVCDPSAVVTDEERANLINKVNQLQSVTRGIRNTSPACVLQPEKNMEIIIAIVDKIGNIPGAPVDIEKFANNLKRRYQNFQDISVCDTTILIVNSRQDRQVFTVAGRDARISKETLKNAFERNIAHFKTGRYALGLEGMIEVIVAAYTNAHIVQIPSQENFRPESNFVPITSEPQPFRAAGIPNSVQPAKKNFEISEQIDEKDQVWVTIMQQALARCGQDTTNLSKHVKAVVEEAMSISLKLISDTRYNSIEEEVETNKDVLGIRDRAWETAKTEFILPLFNRYKNTILNNSNNQCPSSASSFQRKRRV
ncbi:unnamed protein product [Auanema sp. JU1783]|nr:unnamed protein product [Auanema sp. JU1783]